MVRSHKIPSAFFFTVLATLLAFVVFGSPLRTTDLSEGDPNENLAGDGPVSEPPLETTRGVTEADLYSLTEIGQQRPLLSPTRRPPELLSSAADQDQLELPVLEEEPVPSIPEQIEPAPLPELVMLGSITSGAEQRVLIRSENGLEQWMHVGDQIQGWSLVAIQTDSARFSLDTADLVVRLYE